MAIIQSILLTAAAQLPDAPTSVAASATGTTTASVSWNAPASDGGSVITSYTITSSPGGITKTVNQAGGGTTTITGLSEDVSYTFTVYATNAIGNSPNSAASNSVTTFTVPDAPTSVAASATGTTTASVSWNAPASDNGSAITSYTITSSPGGITKTVNQAGGGTTTVTGLSPNTSYTFTVYATNAIGNSPNSSASNSVTTAKAVAPSLEYLIVAGGGGGGYSNGGGGGAGGMRTGSANISAGTNYTITVGGGGGGGTSGRGGKGANSSALSVTSTGGGGGGSYGNNQYSGGSGGSGGGGTDFFGSGGSGISGQGNAGGSGEQGSGGGGGGRGGTGGNGYGPPYGGVGSYSSITGSNIRYAGGGGGYQFNGVSGGAGGGGSSTNVNGTNGTANLGGGGGGGGQTSPRRGGSGGKGVVIVRHSTSYANAVSTTGNPTITTSGGYRIYKFTGSGSIQF